MQFYTGKYLSTRGMGKNGHSYKSYQGFCMETHGYPNAVNKVFLLLKFNLRM